MEHAFIADSMLGKLSRWLRIMGVDTEYFAVIGDADLVERAAATGRLILTRDTLLIRRRGARANHFFVEGDHFRDQLRQVIQRFSIDPFAHFLSRCLECNAPLVAIGREEVRERVPAYVFMTQQAFRTCPSCRRVYWEGTQKARMAEELRSLFGQEEQRR